MAVTGPGLPNSLWNAYAEDFVEIQSVVCEGETLPLLQEIHDFVLRQRVLIIVLDLNVTSTLVLLPSVIFTDGPWPWMIALFWIQVARFGLLPSSFADVCQLQWLQYTPQWNASASSLSPPLRLSWLLADVAFTTAGAASATLPAPSPTASHFLEDARMPAMGATLPQIRGLHTAQVKSRSPGALAGTLAAMSLRSMPAAALVALALAACGGPGGSGYGCSGNTCTATFDGTGSQDLSSQLGDGAKLDLRDINGDTANMRANGTEHNFKVGETQSFGDLHVTLQQIDGNSATFKVVKSG